MLLPDLTRKKSLKERVLFWTVIVLLAAMILSAKPLYQAVKKRRAASLAQQGELLLSQQKGDEALAKLQSALQMDPENLQANYGLARLLTYSRRPEAFRFWETVFAKGGGKPDDRLDAAKLALFLKRFDLTELYLNQVLQQKPIPPEALRIAAIFCDRKNDSAAAISFARDYLQANTNAPEIRLLLARHLLRTGKTEDAKEAKTLLWQKLRAGGNDMAAVIQLLIEAPDLTRAELRELMAALDKIPPNDVVQLVKMDLQTRLNPESKDQLIAKAAADAKSSPDKLLNLSRWLSQKREFGTVQKLVPLDKALDSKELFLVYVDAVAALGKWTELEELFNRKQLPVEPVLAELYRARIATELKKTARAEVYWGSALSLAGQSPEALVYVAEYAERLGILNHAIDAYRQLANDPKNARTAYEALIRIREKQGDTAELRILMKKLVEMYPKDPAPENDLAYLNLLLKNEVDASGHVAEKLVREHPQMLAYRTTLALAFLRSNDAAGAKKAYEGISFAWAEALPGWQAVYVAIIGANGQADLARKMAQTILQSRLKREEKQLIQPWLN